MPLYVNATGCPNACRHCGRSGGPPCRAHYSLDEMRALARVWGPLVVDREPSAHPGFPEVLGPDVGECEQVLATHLCGILCFSLLPFLGAFGGPAGPMELVVGHRTFIQVGNGHRGTVCSAM